MPSTTTSIDLHDPSSKAYKRAKRQYYKATKNRNNDIESEWTPFRAVEKRYKARFPPPDLGDVLDLATLDPLRNDEVHQGGWTGNPHSVLYQDVTSASSSLTARAYTIPHVPGLVIIPGFLSQAEQRDLVKWSLSDHAKYPNETNLDAHYLVPQSGLWDLYVQSLKDQSNDEMIHPRAPISPPDASVQYEQEGPRQLINNTPATPGTLATIASTAKPPPLPSPNAHPIKASDLLPKMRWANIGWFYHWGVKQYDFSKGKVQVDPKLKSICKRAVELVDWSLLYHGTEDAWGDEGAAWKTWRDTYDPDAGIVNFYQTKIWIGYPDGTRRQIRGLRHISSCLYIVRIPDLGRMTAIESMNTRLGNAAIFLIGGLTRDVEPTPILLRSGDVVVMSGPACRRAYHGVPRILEDTLPKHFGSDESEYWSPFATYMAKTRININVRQVFPKGFMPVAPIIS